MRSATQLISLAIGRSPFSQLSELHLPLQKHYFKVYEVDLPPDDFRGFPPKWIFAVLDLQQIASKNATRSHVHGEARAIIASRPDGLPLVLVSENEGWHLGDEFTLPKRRVFCLDANDLPHHQEINTPAQLAPLVLAFRRLIHSKDPSLIWFSPYQCGEPVSGWRFFGRKREIARLVDTHDNYVIVGARRTGKSSLMQEAARRLKSNGENVYSVNVQNCSTPDEVVAALLRELSPRDMVNAGRRAELLHESVFAQVLKRMTAEHSRTTLFLDELGNVIAKLPREDWQFLGLLRKFGQDGRLRFVISCFQEVFLRQAAEFSGPLVNFAATMRLGLFSDADVEEFVLSPLEIWEPLEQAKRWQFLNGIQSVVGRHPFMLQHFCRGLLEQTLSMNEGPDVIKAADIVLRRDLVKCFSEAVHDVFHEMPSATLMYLFVQRCVEADSKNEELRRAEITDDWVDGALLSLGYSSTLAGRRNLLEGLQIHGLTTPVSTDPSRQLVACPVVYLYLKKTVGAIDQFALKLKRDMVREVDVWELRPTITTHNG